MRKNSIIARSLVAIVFAAPIAGYGAGASAQLYENVEVLGDLRCDANADIRTLAGSATRLRCAFTHAGATPDIVRRYFGAVTALEAGNPAGAGATVSWTVLRLKDPLSLTDQGEANILGSYSRA
ncbi:MAG TPA: DUF992 domain-containing protein, partial [Parvularculaceae bacterium]|nr:DUF992 domain-containing protein [Parvularculaceae bacterium]